MKQVPLSFPFFLALAIAIWGTVFFPTVRLFAFAPFLAIVYTKRSLLSSLWISALCGLIIDLLSSEMRLGAYAFSYSLVTLVLYQQKRHFFDEKPLALSLFTALIAASATLVQAVMLYLFGNKIELGFLWVVTDLLGMSLLDALYAFVWFTCPIKLYQHVQRVGWRNLIVKKDE